MTEVITLHGRTLYERPLHNTGGEFQPVATPFDYDATTGRVTLRDHALPLNMLLSGRDVEVGNRIYRLGD